MGSPRDLIEHNEIPERRRKYEIDAAESDGKSKVGIAVGFIVASAFVFLKEAFSAAMGDNTDRSSGSGSGSTEGSAGGPIGFGSGIDDGSEANSQTLEDEGSGRGVGDPPEEGANSNSLFFGHARSFEFNGISNPYGSGTAPFVLSQFRQAENDNFPKGSGASNPFSSGGPFVFSSASGASGAGGALAVVSGDALEIEGDENRDAPELPVPDEGSDDGETDDQPSPRTNRAPFVLGPVRLDGLPINQTLMIAAAHLLLFSGDADGDELRIDNLSVSSGEITLNGQGLWHYTPHDGYLGEVTFSYEVSDGQLAVSQIALLEITQVASERTVGTDGPDDLHGTPGADIIDGLGGDDVIVALGGDDLVDGGAGEDSIIGGDGDDTIYGGTGADLILGGDGDDVVFGGDGDDTIFGEAGSDIIFGEAGDDILDGGSGDDIVEGGLGDDVITGDTGNDHLDGGAGEDEIFGGEGEDVVIAGAGADVARGGAGDDVFLAFVDDGDDDYYGDDGDDSYDVSNTESGATIDLGAGTAQSDDIGVDQVSQIENATGSQGDDVITGDGGGNSLRGQSGGDIIHAQGGNDYLDGGSGDDQAYGGEGDDAFVAGIDDGDDEYYGDEGVDSYDLSQTVSDATVDLGNATASSADTGSDLLSEFENVIGSQGDDSISGEGGDNTLYGSDGDDEVSADFGDDIVIGGSGDDTLRGDDGDDLLYGGFGDDRLEGRDGDDLILGAVGNDRIDGDDGNDVLFGGNGNDRLRGEDGNDVLFGDDGDDDIEGNDGNDTLSGGRGSDVASGGSGDDLFVAEVGDGDDVYDGDSGVDSYDLSQTAADAVVDLAAGSALSLEIGSDQLSGFENVVGGSGNDTLMASAQENSFWGGTGSDLFVFRSAEEAGRAGGFGDRLEDFEIGDRIDVSFIDADDLLEGNQSFEFVLDSNAQVEKGSLVLRYDFDDEDSTAINTVLTGFVNDDQIPDFEIYLIGQHNLSASNFTGVNFGTHA